MQRDAALADALYEVKALHGPFHEEIYLPSEEIFEIFLETEVSVEEPGGSLAGEGDHEVQVASLRIEASASRRAKKTQPGYAVTLAELLELDSPTTDQTFHAPIIRNVFCNRSREPMLLADTPYWSLAPAHLTPENPCTVPARSAIRRSRRL